MTTTRARGLNLMVTSLVVKLSMDFRSMQEHIPLMAFGLPSGLRMAARGILTGKISFSLIWVLYLLMRLAEPLVSPLMAHPLLPRNGSMTRDALT